MRSFEVHAGWLDPIEVIGKCYIEEARGKEIISFSYDNNWLASHPEIILDPDVFPMSGRQFPPSDKSCFGFLSDAFPDRWGRTLMQRRERFDAAEESRPVHTLMESHYILGVHDKGRIGGLRFFDSINKKYLSDRETWAAPPMEMLRKLEQASLDIEESGSIIEKKQLMNLIDPGSSLGGARPKANVIDEHGNIWIAKFPSKQDTINIGAWEMVAHNLAIHCGLNIPDAKIMQFSDFGSTFLTKRFDRIKDKRIHYASAMTLLGKTDGDSSDSSYLDIAELIEQYGNNPEKDLLELWIRIVFYICISNTDDHLRNHGFLLTDGKWDLSPAFDINPSTEKDFLSLSIGTTPNKDLSEALAVSDYFRIPKDEASNLIKKMCATISSNWRKEATRLHINNAEQNLMESSFISSCKKM